MQIRCDVINGERQGVMNLGSDWVRLGVLIGKAVWDAPLALRESGHLRSLAVINRFWMTIECSLCDWLFILFGAYRKLLAS